MPVSLVLWCPLLPLLAMAFAALMSWWVRRDRVGRAWTVFLILGWAAQLASVLALGLLWSDAYRPVGLGPLAPGLGVSRVGLCVAALVQFLGLVVGAFASRYLQGESGQTDFVCRLATILACVHALILAANWWILIAAWSLAQHALRGLLLFYPQRPFAQLAASKKRIADRCADGLLMLAAVASWTQRGDFALPLAALDAAATHRPLALQLSAIGLVLAVVLRSAQFPVHGWLIQVMEAPTPVSALLHAGVVNLGGLVLIRMAPLLDASPAARWVLFATGSTTALLAGSVMLTRISIKVQLAWSTVAQMGFMLLECGVGLYSMAALHLLGHSAYKAQAFLRASSRVRDDRLQQMQGSHRVAITSLWLAPLGAVLLGGAAIAMAREQVWPWWWSGCLMLSWAPVLWWSDDRPELRRTRAWNIGVAALSFVLMLIGAGLWQRLPLGLHDRPDPVIGPWVLVVVLSLYILQAGTQTETLRLAAWRRRAYAGFYIDEVFTRFALWLDPPHQACVAASVRRGSEPPCAASSKG